MLNMIFAHCAHGIVAQNSSVDVPQIPWDTKNQRGDMKAFQRLTSSSSNPTMIMGRKTFESMNRACLKDRRTIVVSSKNFSFSDHLIEDIQQNRGNRWAGAFVIGGPEIWNLFKDQISLVYKTEIFFDPLEDSSLDEVITDRNGDVKLKWLRYSINNLGGDFRLYDESEIFPANNTNQYAYQFSTWERQ